MDDRTLARAIARLDRRDFGKPGVKAIERVINADTTMEARDEAWKLYQTLPATGDATPVEWRIAAELVDALFRGKGVKWWNNERIATRIVAPDTDDFFQWLEIACAERHPFDAKAEIDRRYGGDACLLIWGDTRIWCAVFLRLPDAGLQAVMFDPATGALIGGFGTEADRTYSITGRRAVLL